MPQLSDSDIDLMARTMLAEAGPKASPTEMAAIAHVILNRANAGGSFGDGVSGVISKKNAFEPWSLPPGHPNNPAQIDPESPAYQAAASIAEGAAAGKVKDPTKGSTYFLQPDIVMQRVQSGQMSWPQWAAGKGQRIGQHVFYPPASDDGGANGGTAAQAKAAKDYSALDARYPAAPEPGGAVSPPPATATPSQEQWQASLDSRYPAPPEPGQEPVGGAAPNARVAQGFEDVRPVSSGNTAGEAPSNPVQAQFNRFMNQLVTNPEKAIKDNPATAAALTAILGPVVAEGGGSLLGLLNKGVTKVVSNPIVRYPLIGAGLVTGQQLATDHPVSSLLHLITEGAAH